MGQAAFGPSLAEAEQRGSVMDTARLGMGVMINMLFGDGRETADALSASVGQIITDIKIMLPDGEDDNYDRDRHTDEIVITLGNGKTLRVWDSGQSCCESRYITSDADLTSYIGQTIRDFRQGEYKTTIESESGEEHDVQNFLIDTTEGTIDFVTHVEHNGYYGGFSIAASLS
jgi:hypothetical protein